MKTIKLIFLIAILSFAFGCKKKGCTDLKAENYNRFATVDDGTCTFNDYSLSKSVVTDYVPKFNDNSGTLVAIHRGKRYFYSPYGAPYDWDFNYMAHFDEIGNSNYLDCGELKTNLKIGDQNTYFLTFKVNEDNLYHYLGGMNMQSANDFPDTIRYIATGDNWPAFTIKTTLKFPTINENITPGDINPSTPNKIYLGSVLADSIVVQMFGKNGRLVQVLPGNETSCEFSAAEVSSLGKGSVYISITTQNYEIQTVDSRLYHIVNGRNVIKTVFSY